MTLLACIPVTGCLTLAEVAACSLNAADNTYPLDTAVNVVFEDDGGVDILTLYEASRGVQAHAHAAIGAQAAINGGSLAAGFGIEAIALDIEEIFTGAVAYNIGQTIYLYANGDEPNPFIAGLDVIVSDEGGTESGFGAYGLQFTVNTFNNDDYGFGFIGTSFVRAGDAANVTGGSIAAGITGGTVQEIFGMTLAALIFGGSAASMIALDIFDVDGATTNMAIRTGSGHVVFNEGSHDDTDFRHEGATDANLLVADGSADTVQVGSATASDSAKFYVSGKISASGEIEINGALNHDGTELGVFATAPTTQKTVTGSRGGNAALASLLTQLAAYGLIIDSSTA